MGSEADRRYVLTLGCADRPGIVAEITSFLAGFGGSIVEAGYHADIDSGWFFTRQAVRADSVPFGLEELRERCAQVVGQLGTRVDWQVHDSALRRRIVVLVSTAGHCLHDLLGRATSGELPATIEAVVGNHRDLHDMTTSHGVPFHHVPFPGPPDSRTAAFEELRQLVDSYHPDTIVLARFMQVLPEQLCTHWEGRAINIHHSFLPSFAGARPYHQAFARGVKLIGATCHYVTPELDAGPIIEQDVQRIDHSDTVADLVRQGRDIERVVLARGVRWHVESRVLVHHGRTTVFR